MPITDGEARLLFEKLAVQLRHRGAGTVVDQVIDEIAQGKQIIYKTVRRRTSALELYWPEGNDLASDRGGRREYAETLQYSPTERLDLLLQALERAIIDSAAIDEELVKLDRRIQFVAEQEGGNQRPFVVGGLLQSPKELGSIRVHIAQLRALMEG
jgi:hypothetical protein